MMRIQKERIPECSCIILFPGTSGIPQKAILINGHIRYRAEGYGGSPSGLMDEISYVIEILKEEGNHVEK